MPPPLTNLQATFQNFGKEWRALGAQIQRTRITKGVLLGSALFMGLSKVIVIPVLLQMLVYTLPIIYYGAHLSLDGRVLSQELNSKAEAEVMTAKDAAWFPVVASASILGLYMAFKLLPPYWVNLTLSLFISATGIWCVSESIAGIIRLINPDACTQGKELDVKIPRGLHYALGESIHLDFSPRYLFAYAGAVAVCFGWLITKAWALHNLFAIAFSIQAIRYLSFGKFKIASGLLIALFFYDIFWVFGTEVMVSVAKSFDAPIKILFPTGGRPSLLGLGDIVLPGGFIAMTLRFDYWLWAEKTDDAHIDKSTPPMFRSFPKFYFLTSVISYALSLLLTGVVMIVWQKPQPALLYLVPTVLLALYIPAVFRRELGKVIEYDEEGKEEAASDDEDDGEDEGNDDEATTASLETRKDK